MYRKKIEYKINFPKEVPFLLKVMRVLDGKKEDFWYKYDGCKGKTYPLVLDGADTSENEAKHSKYSSQEIFEAVDEYGTARKIDSDFYKDRYLSLLFYPEIKKEKDYVCVVFSEEDASVAQFCKKHMTTYFSFISDDNEIRDSYSTNLYFDDRRVV